MILSSCALLLSLLLVAFVWLRRVLERREAQRQAKDFEEQMEKDRLGGWNDGRRTSRFVIIIIYIYTYCCYYHYYKCSSYYSYCYFYIGMIRYTYIYIHIFDSTYIYIYTFGMGQAFTQTLDAFVWKATNTSMFFKRNRSLCSAFRPPHGCFIIPNIEPARPCHQ